MYNILKSVIDRGEYSLPNIEQKIDKLWTEDKITDGQRGELVNLARGGVKPENNVDLFKTVMALEKRVKALEEGTNEPNSETPPEWVDGMVVYRGARVRFKGEIHRCIAPEGYPCSWAPYGDNGYPPYWERE